MKIRADDRGNNKNSLHLTAHTTVCVSMASVLKEDDSSPSRGRPSPPRRYHAFHERGSGKSHFSLTRLTEERDDDDVAVAPRAAAATPLRVAAAAAAATTSLPSDAAAQSNLGGGAPATATAQTRQEQDECKQRLSDEWTALMKWGGDKVRSPRQQLAPAALSTLQPPPFRRCAIPHAPALQQEGGGGEDEQTANEGCDPAAPASSMLARRSRSVAVTSSDGGRGRPPFETWPTNACTAMPPPRAGARSPTAAAGHVLRGMSAADRVRRACSTSGDAPVSRIRPHQTGGKSGDPPYGTPRKFAFSADGGVDSRRDRVSRLFKEDGWLSPPFLRSGGSASPLGSPQRGPSTLPGTTEAQRPDAHGDSPGTAQSHGRPAHWPSVAESMLPGLRCLLVRARCGQPPAQSPPAPADATARMLNSTGIWSSGG